MSRIGKLGCLALLGLSGSAASSCADNESMLYVRGVMYSDPGSCDLVADSSAALLLDGMYDVGFNYGYRASLLVGDQLAARGQKSRSRTETSSILLEGAEVTVVRANGSALRPAFTAPGAGFIQVGTGEDSGFGIINVVLIPKLTAAELKDKTIVGGYVVAEVRVFGHTLGGTAVESGLYKFPISVCDGCLVGFSAASLVANACVPAEDSASTRPCAIGQDQPVDCGVCASSVPACQVP